MKRKLLALILLGVLGVGTLAGCAKTEDLASSSASEAKSEAKSEATSESATSESATSESATSESATSESATSASAASSASEATEEVAGRDKELLVVSFGTSYNNNRNVTIGGIENAMREAYPDFLVRRAFTAQIIIDILKERDGIEIDNVKEALDRAVADGIKTLVIQPTHLMHGFEYDDLVAEVAEYEGKFESLAIAEPLLTSDEDMKVVAESVHEAMEAYDNEETAVVLMGHGTEHEANEVYGKMQTVFTDLGYDNFYVGTVEAEPTCEDVLEAVKDKGYKKVVLRPLMVVAGDHANNDMADPEDEESWYSQFTAAGYEVECVLEGLGQIYPVQQVYVDHTAEVMESLGVARDTTVAVNSISDGDPEKAILVTSFGTSYNNSRNLTVGGIENVLRERFPEYQIRRAFTAQIIIDILKERDGIAIDNFEEAMDRAVADGIRELIIQPTHLMDGFEYNDVKDAMSDYEDKFDKLVLSEPLLMSDDDFNRTAEALHTQMEKYDDGKTAIVFMGHGTEAESNAVYQKMQDTLNGLGYNNFYVGTVEAEPTCEDVLEAIKNKGYENVVLRALMVVAGDHANNDMADPEDEESWYSQFTAAGYNVSAVLQGLGQVEEIAEIYVDHAKAAVAG